MSASTSYAVTVNGLCKSYGPIKALNGICATKKLLVKARTMFIGVKNTLIKFKLSVGIPKSFVR